ncbi:glycosyltransferase family 39 protein [Thermococcus sp. ES12]|uniref:glycosyltransferase family 39 protein n=1 Tax=Thermococcus sp. ES12 TaxID=1638246 RepID=UPI001F0DB6A3|nr:glycosyltransferase family 39 protein [Thermococcus sp. ES12]
MAMRRIGTFKLQCNNPHVYLFLGYLIIIAGIITFPYFLTRKTPPGYIIGGDTLVHAAIARGIYLGRNPFLDQTYNIYPNWYPFLYHIVVASAAKATGMSIETIMIAFQAFLAITMILVLFYVARGLWGAKAGVYAASLSLMLLGSHIYPNPKELAPLLGVLSIYFVLKRMYVPSGFLLGLAFWTHYAFTLPLVGLPILFAIVQKEKKNILVPILAFLIFSPFVINAAVHSGRLPQIESIYNPWETDTLVNKLKSLLPPVYLVPFLVLSFLRWNRERDPLSGALFLLVGIIAIARLFPELLQPFGVYIWSKRFVGMLRYIYTLLSAYGASGVELSTKRASTLLTVTMLLLVPLAGAVIFWDSVDNDQFVWISEYDFSLYYPEEHFLEVSSWIWNNTERDDVIATSEEVGMVLNALTGRPIVATLYGHGNTFIDNQKRREDLEQLFTSSCNRKKEIVARYDVKVIITEPFVYEHWNVTDIECIAVPVYQIENVTIWEVKE